MKICLKLAHKVRPIFNLVFAKCQSNQFPAEQNTASQAFYYYGN